MTIFADMDLFFKHVGVQNRGKEEGQFFPYPPSLPPYPLIVGVVFHRKRIIFVLGCKLHVFSETFMPSKCIAALCLRMYFLITVLLRQSFVMNDMDLHQ